MKSRRFLQVMEMHVLGNAVGLGHEHESQHFARNGMHFKYYSPGPFAASARIISGTLMTRGYYDCRDCLVSGWANWFSFLSILL